MGHKQVTQPLLVSATVATAYLDDEAVLLEVDGAQLHHLNACGTQIWKMITDGQTEAEIASTIAAMRGDADAATEVTGFLSSLRAARLVVESA